MDMRCLPLLFSFLLMGGCLSVLPEPEAPEGLYAVSSPTTDLALAHTVIISEFEAPRIMAGTGLISEADRGGFRLIRSVEWSDRLTRLMQLALVDSFASQGEEGVAVLPEAGVLAPYRAAGRIHKLVLRGDVAVCEASLVITDLKQRTVVAQPEAKVQLPVLENALEDRALTLAAVAGACAADLAVSLTRTLAALSE